MSIIQVLNVYLERARERIVEQKWKFAEEKAKSVEIEVKLWGKINLAITRESQVAELNKSHHK